MGEISHVFRIDSILFGLEELALKKRHQDIRDLVYVHLNQADQYVLSYGIEFAEFAAAFSGSLNHLLLLKHRFEDADFNMHTLLEYCPEERINNLRCR